MRTRWILVICLCIALWLGLSALASPSLSLAAIVTRPGSTQQLDSSTLLKKWAAANVVYLGETHDRPEDHAAQLEILQALYRHRPNLTIGLEMFQQPYQRALADYLAGKITETELQTQSQFVQRWGFPWEFYAPILRFAKDRRVPVLALNTPREVTRKVAKTGLQSLTAEDFRYIPPVSEVQVGPPSYRDRLRQIYDEGHQGMGNNQGFDRFFQAQVLWDETMAERIADALENSPKTLVVVLVGQGHLLYGEGIPDRVRRRIPAIVQHSVLLNPAPELRQEKIADYFWDSVGSK